MADCALCDPNLGPIIAESEYWSLVLNRNQDLLGKCFLSLRRHTESVPDLSPTEWMDLREQVKRGTNAIVSVFGPDHFNYAFLQNQDRHVHFHLIPRYAAERAWGGLRFVDPDFPDHYAVPGNTRLLPADQHKALADLLRRRIDVVRHQL